MKFTVTFNFKYSDYDQWESGHSKYDTVEEAIADIEYMRNCDLYSYISDPLVPYENPKFPEHFKN